MAMKKSLTTFLFCLPIVTSACSGYVIGYKGINDVFDSKAFNEYANQISYCNHSYSWYQIDESVKLINSLNVPYHFYGFSKGAATVSEILKTKKVKKPEFIITIGAYKTTDVNFNRYDVKYKNYFDESGIGQNSPGLFLNVPHIEMQKEVNRIFKY